MPDQHDPDKCLLGVRVERTLKARLKKLAKSEGMSLSDYVRPILHEAVKHVTLSSHDYEQIAKDTRKAEQEAKTGKRRSRDSD